MPVVLLKDRAVLAVAGPDAASFLQGLVTADMDDVAAKGAGYGALLSPQGKILADFIVVQQADGALIDVQRGLAPDLLRRLTLYRLRAKVTLAETDLAVAAGWDEPPANAVTDPRLSALGFRRYGRDMPGGASQADYDARRIRLGVPEGGVDFAYGDAFPHEIAMDMLGGVDFTKGCYVGQEVVSRMHHRGTARSRPVLLRGDSPLPPTGTPVTADNRPVGTLGSVADRDGIAILRLDRVAAARAAGVALLAGDVPVAPTLPPYARYDWPDAA